MGLVLIVKVGGLEHSVSVGVSVPTPGVMMRRVDVIIV